MKALFLGLAFLAASFAAGAQGGYDKRADVKAFVQGMVERHGFNEKELLFLFSRVQRREAILQAITPPPPGKGRSWNEYRGIFVNDPLVKSGAAFWRQHAETLARASREYGVPPEIIVAIIGIETIYGRNMGKWRVVDALTTLGFDYPPRAEYFRGELENYLLLARDAGFDVFSVLGSYAGAIGIPQFMPTSILKWAVDFDGNGSTDLRNSPADAIGSVANFLKQHGWRAGEPILLPATVSGTAWRPYADGTVLPKHPLTDIGKAGVAFSGGLPATQGIVIELENRDSPNEYRVGLMNFWVITRYNRSSFYATAVFDLGEAIKAARN
jgi:membrane-bound lytic murein transglycosylase B